MRTKPTPSSEVTVFVGKRVEEEETTAGLEVCGSSFRKQTIFYLFFMYYLNNTSLFIDFEQIKPIFRNAHLRNICTATHLTAYGL